MDATPLPVTLRQLQYAVAAADTLHFRRAAERCHVSQPSLSAQIAELERALGVRLFERDRRRVLLTPAGHDLAERARGVLVAAGDLVTAARGLADPLGGRLRIGIIPTIGPYLLPDAVPRLRSVFPEARFEWSEEKTEVLMRRLAAGELDAGVLADVGGVEAFERASLGEDRFVLVTPLGHRLGRSRGPLHARDLAGESVLLLEDGHCLREQALEVCAVGGAEELGYRATSLSTLVQMVSGGAGVTLLPAVALEAERQRSDLTVREFAAPVPARRIVLAWRRGSPLAPALRRLAAELSGLPVLAAKRGRQERARTARSRSGRPG